MLLVASLLKKGKTERVGAPYTHTHTMMSRDSSVRLAGATPVNVDKATSWWRSHSAEGPADIDKCVVSTAAEAIALSLSLSLPLTFLLCTHTNTRASHVRLCSVLSLWISCLLHSFLFSFACLVELTHPHCIHTHTLPFGFVLRRHLYSKDVYISIGRKRERVTYMNESRRRVCSRLYSLFFVVIF